MGSKNHCFEPCCTVISSIKAFTGMPYQRVQNSMLHYYHVFLLNCTASVCHMCQEPPLDVPEVLFKTSEMTPTTRSGPAALRVSWKEFLQTLARAMGVATSPNFSSRSLGRGGSAVERQTSSFPSAGISLQQVRDPCRAKRKK